MSETEKFCPADGYVFEDDSHKICGVCGRERQSVSRVSLRALCCIVIFVLPLILLSPRLKHLNSCKFVE